MPDRTDWRSERPMGAAAAAAAAAAGPPVVGVAVADPAAAAEEFEEESFLGAAGVAAGAEDCAGVEAADAVLLEESEAGFLDRPPSPPDRKGTLLPNS